MTHKLIKTDNYLLVVDDSEIKIGDHFYDNDGEVCKYDELYVVDPNDFNDNQKIITHLPLNGSPILEGVNLLPAYEDDVNELAKHHFRKSEYEIKLREEAFKEGYNQAREKYKYTESDMIKAFSMARRLEDWWDLEFTHSYEDIIKHISEYPKEFECETVTIPSYKDSNGNIRTEKTLIKTITTDQGIQWVGKYK